MHAPNAALLIDFDNVTLGIQKDLTKELRTLLNSDIIKGKVAVQRAYADWRRYPQYIVPLSESSIDLIFAPAFGSSTISRWHRFTMDERAVVTAWRSVATTFCTALAGLPRCLTPSVADEVRTGLVRRPSRWFELAANHASVCARHLTQLALG